jgi:TatD DNase family protein
MEKLIDFHTHSPNPHHECIYILDPRDDQHLLDDFRFCFGLHPWFIDAIQFDAIESKLKQYIKHPNFFALGECGLDRTRDQFELQKDILLKHFDLANELEIQAMVFHNVKSDADFLGILKRVQPKQKLIFHDFNSNQEMVEKLLQYDSYFSIGSSIMNGQRKITETIKDIPLERLFLETDDQTNISLEAIYSKASDLLSIPLEDLTTQIRGNFNKFSS